MFDHDTARKGVRFCLTGACVFFVDMGMLWVWVRLVPPLVAVTIAYVIAVATHFCLNKWWVFRNQSGGWRIQILKYLLTVAACWLCTVLVFSLALRWVTANIFLAKIIALPLATLLGFLMMNGFVFRPKPVRSPGEP